MPSHSTTVFNCNTAAQAITVVFVLMILAGTLLPANELPKVETGDKAIHLIAFAILALPLNMVVRQRWLLLNLTFIVFGGAIEIIQPFVGRHGEWLDFGADTLGVLAGAIAASGLRILTSRDD